MMQDMSCYMPGATEVLLSLYQRSLKEHGPRSNWTMFFKQAPSSVRGLLQLAFCVDSVRYWGTTRTWTPYSVVADLWPLHCLALCEPMGDPRELPGLWRSRSRRLESGEGQ